MATKGRDGGLSVGKSRGKSGENWVKAVIIPWVEHQSHLISRMPDLKVGVSNQLESLITAPASAGISNRTRPDAGS